MTDDGRQLIDWHMHVWLPEHLGREWVADLSRNYGGDDSPMIEQAHFEDIEAGRAAAGVEKAIVIGNITRHLGVEVPNEFIAEYVERDPAHTVGLAGVDPNDADAADQLRYARETLGLRGLKLAPPYQAFHPHAPEALELYGLASDLGMPVMFHQGAVFARRGILEYANAALLDLVARDFPELKIIVAHMGQPWYFETVALMYKHRNVFADLSARFHRPWQLHNMLLAAMDYGVTDRILFGSDFPVTDTQFCLDAFRNINTLTEGKLPEIPAGLIEEIIYERPFSLVGLEV
ncbi:MAG: amidohydrolase [Actinobacteria bacterium]|nr:amidohydrolase [Actinomycetota bacterium]